MTCFTVLLEVVSHGAVVGSTRDDVDAETADQAEEFAIARWRAARPDCSFRPLFTTTAPG